MLGSPDTSLILFPWSLFKPLWRGIWMPSSRDWRWGMGVTVMLAALRTPEIVSYSVLSLSPSLAFALCLQIQRLTQDYSPLVHALWWCRKIGRVRFDFPVLQPASAKRTRYNFSTGRNDVIPPQLESKEPTARFVYYVFIFSFCYPYTVPYGHYSWCSIVKWKKQAIE